METTVKSPQMEKKIRLFRHHHSSSYYYCYQGVFLHDNKQLFLLPSVAPLAAGVQHGFLFPSGKVQRKANLKSWGGEESWERQVFFCPGTEKEVLPKDFVLLGEACGDC